MCGTAMRGAVALPGSKATRRSIVGAASLSLHLQPQLYKPADGFGAVRLPAILTLSLSACLRITELDLFIRKGNFPYRQTRLCEIAKALIFVFRPRDAAAHFLALKPSSTSRRMASARVGRSLCFAAHASNALSGLGCKRTTTCTPGLELRGFGASTNCILLN